MPRGDKSKYTDKQKPSGGTHRGRLRSIAAFPLDKEAEPSSLGDCPIA